MKESLKSQVRYSTWDMKQFIIGFVFGILISLLYNSVMYFNIVRTSSNILARDFKNFEDSIKENVNYLNFYGNKQTGISNQIHSTESKNVCGYGKNGPRILCTVFTYKKMFNLKAQYVEKTWGKRCDKTIFISGYVNETEKHLYSHLNIVYLNVTEQGRKKLTEKTVETLLYAYKEYINDFDWILKADDDTYVIMENLKRFLFNKCPASQTYYGFKYKSYETNIFRHDFNSGGAGYVISNKVVRKFAETYNENTNYCRNNSGMEDVDIAKCLREIGVIPGDSRDEKGLERFHPLSFESMWSITPKNRTYHHARYTLKQKEECCSSSSISFHYTAGQKALQMDYLLYNMRPQVYY